MEHLTKQQIVLLTLLVSFVTSLSTGIVTVSLMDQAPSAVTHTINQIIEKTVTAPQTASVGTVAINVDDQIAHATALVASSTVKIKSANTDQILGYGLIMSKNGTIIADKSIIDQNQSYVAVLADGTSVPVSTSLMYSNQTNSNYIYLTPMNTFSNVSLPVFLPAKVSTTFTLGQKIFSLAGSATFSLNDGLITEIGSSTIKTSIPDQKNISGSPLFDIEGNVIGVFVSSVFYPIAPLIP